MNECFARKQKDTVLTKIGVNISSVEVSGVPVFRLKAYKGQCHSCPTSSKQTEIILHGVS